MSAYHVILYPSSQPVVTHYSFALSRLYTPDVLAFIPGFPPSSPMVCLLNGTRAQTPTSPSAPIVAIQLPA
ncbi:hypothetical protein MA16_Dca013629 [Dendrobium catenatum]|uniref:Uncharacterized protein n=1 Tax=Dendrobium catenatum TaxID=906689 RepID=A0A2I0WB02_9ASPA|nr:hypothetical protein MA16_Dca013629 [Dendrobium catenatum]